MSTPHISAEPGDFAPAVLMPGDPRRAERMAAQLMPDARKVTDVRGIGGYTGTYQGKPLSIMASGMGQPSLSIYATELYRFFGVERIIRVGTCGGLSPDVEPGDVVVAIGAHTDSSLNDALCPGIHFSATASWNLLKAAVDAAGDDASVKVAPVVSRDRFYDNPPEQVQRLAELGTLGVEMEAAALYGLAAQLHKEALAVLTVSDHLLDPSKDMSAEDRETKFQTALSLAVAAALS
ncbi:MULTISPECIES: purine-nucleoside phosphorylase [unclassified Actinobaculum]|uniref:purine-nucleoside phosphorylase n=1 Tax=unclassified Actinobaculum TaxID=2609299 RepID=UPI000D526010|nr:MULTISPECIES: purine-nucleoside phosphorylase [unclassified Actinobaculum]AWE42274.1 purine-nucleoside phosphorylase [Actinobaculum sp. 313]MBE6484096.1 purine-nucleoside phosphorylase [Actinomycetaceae bacterium]RTE50843.1 purine-nucleoside phosphorylase [Actinobaculum sp. 352]